MWLSGKISFHIGVICICPLQGRSCALALFQAVPWSVPSASRLMSTTVRSASADHGLRSANPLYVTSTVPLDTCTYSPSESIFTTTPLLVGKVQTPGTGTGVSFVGKAGRDAAS